MSTNSRLFQNVAVQDARHNTDHYLVLDFFLRAAPAAHLYYLGNHTRFTIRPQAPPYKPDSMFAELWKAIPSLPW